MIADLSRHEKKKERNLLGAVEASHDFTTGDPFVVLPQGQTSSVIRKLKIFTLSKQHNKHAK